MSVTTRSVTAEGSRPLSPEPVHRHADAHRHEATGHAPDRRRPTALASAAGARLTRVGAALAVLWLAVAWALWWG